MTPSAIVASRVLAVAYAVLVYGMALGLAACIVRRGEAGRLTASTSGRVGTLDGLRGILALGVFVHHTLIAFVWAQTGTWAIGPNAVVNQLGQSGVALFFMITGFLFTLKTTRPMRWSDFYVGRLARLGPLYAVFVIAVVSIVLVLTNGELREPFWTVARELATWTTFMVFGYPSINGYADTMLIGAGVNWSLKYEVIFYVVGVPLLRAIDRLAPGRLGLVFSILLFAIAMAVLRRHEYVQTDPLFVCQFLVGVVVARLYALPRSRTLLQTPWVRWTGAAAACALCFVVESSTAKAVVAVGCVFAAAVGGGSIFGLLKTRAAIWLGDVSYGVYLLHGIVLWFVLRVVFVSTSLLEFVAIALAIGVVVVLLASASYLWLELPIMRLARRKAAAPKSATAPIIA